MKVKLIRADVESAAEHLGISGADIDSVTLADVRKVFGEAVRDVHPDTSGKQSSFDAADKIATFRAARDMLTEWIKGRPDPSCTMCNGSGYYKGLGFSSRPCPRCT